MIKPEKSYRIQQTAISFMMTKAKSLKPYNNPPNIPQISIPAQVMPTSYLDLFPQVQSRIDQYSQYFYNEISQLNIDIDRRIKLARIVKAFVQYGYGIKYYHKCYPYDHIQQHQYQLLIITIVKTTFRMLQDFILKFCNTMLNKLHHQLQLKYIFQPLLNYRQHFKNKKVLNTYHKLLKIIYKVTQNLQNQTLTKQQLLELYNTIIERVLQKVLKLAMNQKPQQIDKQIKFQTEQPIKQSNNKIMHQFNQIINNQYNKDINESKSQISNQWNDKITNQNQKLTNVINKKSNQFNRQIRINHRQKQCLQSLETEKIYPFNNNNLISKNTDIISQQEEFSGCQLEQN